MRRLIVNADDFGLVPDVSDAIVDTYLAGSVTSTTLMVNTPGTEHAARLAHSNPGLAVGLHFNLTVGRPLSSRDEVTSLVEESGDFYDRNILGRKVMCRRVLQSDIEKELYSQLARFRELGLSPTHIDSHQHVHAFPIIFDVVARACSDLNIPIRMPWLLKLADARPSFGRRLRQIVLGRMLHRNQERWSTQLRWNQGLGSLFDLGAFHMPPVVQDYGRILQQVSESPFELMVHPSRSVDAVKGLTRIGDVSVAEWKLLRGPEFAQVVEEMGFTLSTFANVGF